MASPKSAKLILMVDDDVKLTSLVGEYIGRFGFELVAAHEPEAGLQLLRSGAPAALILDVMLPEKDGFQLCREIRQESQVPILMLTARGELTDRVVGLELGADDYLPKPFEPRELVARLQSMIRRSEGRVESGETLRFKGGLQLDLRKREVSLRGKPVELTTAEFDLLALLARKAGAVLSRDEILDRLKGQSWEAFNRSIDVTLSRLRQKLGEDPKNPRFFKTIWGSGYSFVAEPDHET